MSETLVDVTEYEELCPKSVCLGWATTVLFILCVCTVGGRVYNLFFLAETHS